MLATIVGVIFCISDMVINKSIGSIVVLFWLCMNMYFLIMSVIFLSGRVNYRNDERFYAKVLVSFFIENRKIDSYTCDISENGFSFIADFPEFVNDV